MKPIFSNNGTLGLQLIAFLIISSCLMFLDHHSPNFHYYRNKISVVVLPLQLFVDVPIRTTHWFITSMAEQKNLVEDNAKLRARELLLEAKLQRLMILEKENTQLRELLQSTPQIAGKVLVAQLLAVDLDPSFHQVIVDKGARNHIQVGQPVLDAYGVLGQIINVEDLTSKVLLITDNRSAIPVQDYRNGIRAIAVGLGRSDLIAVINIPDTADIRKGDLFVTSGLGLRFPSGYPVGVVSELDHSPGDRFAKILLTPASHLDQTQQVLLVWPDKAELQQEVRNLLAQPVPTVSSETS